MPNVEVARKETLASWEARAHVVVFKFYTGKNNGWSVDDGGFDAHVWLKFKTIREALRDFSNEEN